MFSRNQNSSDRAASQATWIVAIVLTVYGYILHKFVSIFTKRVLSPVSLKPYKDSAILPVAPVSENIAELYELMCITDPLRYKNDPRLKRILTTYRDILHGKIADPDGRNIPSEYINDKRNPDYATYLRAQKKYLGACWVSSELKRIRTDKSISETLQDFAGMLLEAGFPAVHISAALKEERINTFTVEDWKTFIAKTLQYAKSYEEESLYHFMDTVIEKDRYLDTDALDKFSIFYEAGVPLSLVSEIVGDSITIDQARRIIEYKKSMVCTWFESMTEILTGDAQEIEEHTLTQKYQRSVRRG